MTNFGMANMVSPLLFEIGIYGWLMSFLLGLRSGQVYDQMLRGKLPRIPGRSACPQGTLAFLRFVGFTTAYPAFGFHSNLFTGFWSIIKGWLDPVVAGKIHFTKNASDLEKFIPLDRVPKELDGKENWEYEYVEPKPEENQKMEDTATRDSLLAERQEIAKELQKVTISWLKAHSGQDKEAISASEEKRSELISKLRHHYWQLDPYIRSRSFYDRTNVIQEGGKIQFYPESSK